MKTKVRKITSLFMALAMVLGLFAGMPLTAYASHDNDVIDMDVFSFGTDVLAAAGYYWTYDSASKTITVTDNVEIIGTVINAANRLNIDIPAGKTVTWKADYSGGIGLELINVTNNGTLTIVDCTITNTAAGAAINYGGNGSTNITGNAIVKAAANSASVVGSNGTVNVSGNAQVTSSGSQPAIGGPTINISGGTISNTGTGNAVGNTGTTSVTVSGGTVATEGTGYAIYAAGNVNVSGGTVSSASGSSSTIRTSNAITVSGGTVLTEGTGNSLNAGSGGVTLSGGTIVAPRIEDDYNVAIVPVNGAIPPANLYPVTITGLPNGTYANPVANTSGFEMKTGGSSGYNKAWMPAAASQTYTVNVGGTNYTATGEITAAGPNTLNFMPPAIAPAITTHPANRSITSGQNTTFNVAASGTPAPTYQWQVDTGSGWGNVTNGGIYSGAASATLTLTSVPLANNGYQYRCVATNAAGSATSNAATLTVTGGGGGGGGSTTTNASISPTKADFDKNGGKDIAITLNKGSYSLNSLTNGSYTLKNGTDYTVSGNTYTIKADYLKTLATGSNTLTFNMSGGTSPKFTVTVKDTTPAKINNPFKDVASSAWYYDAVMYVYEKGLMIGTADDTFGVNTNLTRGMIVTILYRHAGEPSVTGLSNPFDDVAEGQWYSNAIKWAYANGIVAGYGNGKFGPNDALTNEQLATLIHRTQQSDKKIPPNAGGKTISDADKVSGWAKEYVSDLNKQGIFDDIPGAAFNPQSPASRAEIASMLYKWLTAVEK